MRLTVVIPAHNEAQIITDTIKAIEDKLNLNYEIIVVNDYSTDRTALIVENLMNRYANLKLIDNDMSRGFGNALRKGFSVSSSDLVIPVMADLCDDPDTIEQMHAKSLEGFDIVSGSRYAKGGARVKGPWLQAFFSRFVGCSLKYLIGIPTSDVANSFKCYRKEVLNALDLKSKGFEISMEITLKAYFAGFKITEVPTTWKGRFIGKSKFYLLKVAPRYIKLYLWALFNGIVKYINQRILYRKGGVGVFIPPIVPHVWGVLSERRERRRGACPPSGRKFRAESHSERKRGIFLK